MPRTLAIRTSCKDSTQLSTRVKLAHNSLMKRPPVNSKYKKLIINVAVSSALKT